MKTENFEVEKDLTEEKYFVARFESKGTSSDGRALRVASQSWKCSLAVDQQENTGLGPKIAQNWIQPTTQMSSPAEPQSLWIRA